MKRNVRGGIIKHYCDKCGKNIYDYIPKKEQSGIQVFGMTIPEYSVKRYCDYRVVTSRKNRGDYCLECHNKLEW